MENLIDEITVSYKTSCSSKVKISNSRDAEKYFRMMWNIDTIELFEEFKVIFLNNASEVLGIYNVSKGGISSTVVEIKHILCIALKTNSTSIVLAHNHPSGNLKPSKNDTALTERLQEACKILDLILTDHVILTAGCYYSFKDEGLI